MGRYVLETLPGRDGDWLAVFLLVLEDEIKDGIWAVIMDLWEPVGAEDSIAVHAARSYS